MEVTIKVPRVFDNGRGIVAVMMDGRTIRGFSYQNANERAINIEHARAFVDGWQESAIHNGKPI
jgi:hypothetical protein